MKVLIVEDDPTISQFIQRGLTEAGFEASTVPDGQIALAQAQTNRFDLFIVDVMLPKLDGLELVRLLRKSGSTTPVIILSAKRSIEDRVSGLQVGDDYLVKPFAFPELVARVHALLRRAQPKAEPLQISLGSLRVDLLKREVYREDTRIDLKAKEFSLIEFFMKNPNRVIAKSEILENIWGYNFDPQTNVVDVLVCRLRNKVDKDFEEKTIQTVRGVGYVFKTI